MCTLHIVSLSINEDFHFVAEAELRLFARRRFNHKNAFSLAPLTLLRPAAAQRELIKPNVIRVQ